MKRPGARSLALLWPAFLMAGVLEMLVFSVVDPQQLALFGGEALGWSSTAVYTLAFFVFWGVIAAAAAMTHLLAAPPEEVNRGDGP